ncbi:MAG: SRPBCC family protein [Verrucomicrobia bacterium]|nr:MAG: SRPBCC family protein [Verrucomicrobiota bacterium]
MREFLYECELWVPRPRSEVFEFFADAANLQAITPDWLDFRIETPLPIVMRAGALIDYRLKVHGIPLRWRTEILEWDPPNRFVDFQVRGPYRLWHHTHVFEDRDGGTLCRDRVRYNPPGGVLADRLLVRRDIARIFACRREALAARFAAGGS